METSKKERNDTVDKRRDAYLMQTIINARLPDDWWNCAQLYSNDFRLQREDTCCSTVRRNDDTFRRKKRTTKGEKQWGNACKYHRDLHIVQEPFEELIRSDQTTRVQNGEKARMLNAPFYNARY